MNEITPELIARLASRIYNETTPGAGGGEHMPIDVPHSATIPSPTASLSAAPPTTIPVHSSPAPHMYPPSAPPLT
ncbi:MAG TPA: hypothetical protein PLV92_15235, partial [Pirellulaceae bacterium]|nr:hypothetical protein [Pirellulaceae bacterium]